MKTFFLKNLACVALGVSVVFPLHAQVTVNGTLGSTEGYALKCLQNNYTQFGNATTSTVTESPGGSELDGAYAKIANNTLYLFFAGNLEGAPNNNRLEIFLDTKTGGQNVLTNTNNKPSDFEDPNKMAGIKFDTPFESDYWFTLGSFKSGTSMKAFIYMAETNGDPVNGFIDNPLPDITIDNTGGPYAWTYLGGQLGFNNSNNAGVGGAVGEVGGNFDPATVLTGFEFAIPLAYIGNPSGDIKVCAFINSGAHDYVSNQFLCGLGGTANNLQNPNPASPNYLAGVDLSVIPDDQYFVVSQPVGIDAPVDVLSLQLSPMPATDHVTLRFSLPQGTENQSSVEIYSLSGQRIQATTLATQVGENQATISVADFAPGVYVLSLKNGHFVSTQKLVVKP